MNEDRTALLLAQAAGPGELADRLLAGRSLDGCRLWGGLPIGPDGAVALITAAAAKRAVALVGALTRPDALVAVFHAERRVTVQRAVLSHDTLPDELVPDAVARWRELTTFDTDRLGWLFGRADPAHLVAATGGYLAVDETASPPVSSHAVYEVASAITKVPWTDLLRRPLERFAGSAASSVPLLRALDRGWDIPDSELAPVALDLLEQASSLHTGPAAIARLSGLAAAVAAADPDDEAEAADVAGRAADLLTRSTAGSTIGKLAAQGETGPLQLCGSVAAAGTFETSRAVHDTLVAGMSAARSAHPAAVALLGQVGTDLDEDAQEVGSRLLAAFGLLTDLAAADPLPGPYTQMARDAAELPEAVFARWVAVDPRRAVGLITDLDQACRLLPVVAAADTAAEDDAAADHRRRMLARRVLALAGPELLDDTRDGIDGLLALLCTDRASVWTSWVDTCWIAPDRPLPPGRVELLVEQLPPHDVSELLAQLAPKITTEVFTRLVKLPQITGELLDLFDEGHFPLVERTAALWGTLTNEPEVRMRLDERRIRSLDAADLAAVAATLRFADATGRGPVADAAKAALVAAAVEAADLDDTALMVTVSLAASSWAGTATELVATAATLTPQAACTA